jgi:hypothetical protein
MRIDFNRICKLAGVSNQRSSGVLNEAYEGKDHYTMEGESANPEAMEETLEEVEEEAMEEGDYNKGMDSDMEEEVEVDIAELMSEIRRAKKLIAINESKKRNLAKRKQRLQENHLKRIIQQEVENVLSEIEDKDSSWVYGKKKPRHSKKGFTNHGRTLPGIGFRK